jgi:ribosomal protein L11 methyltransferase
MRCDVNAHFPESFDLLSVVDEVRCSFDLGTTPRFEVDDVPDLDWVQHVQSSWKPVVVGDFILKFPWHSKSDVQEAIESRNDGSASKLSDYQELLLEGGIAFGTGEHPTTQLCLEWITTLMQGNSKVENFLDYGAGSGVLGIAACKLMPSTLEAIGIEIDTDAIRIADANAVNNNVQMKNYLPITLGDDDASASVIMKAKHRSLASTLPSNLDGPIFDACAANILAGPLISLSRTIAGFLKPGGKLGLSGILSWQGDDVVEAYSEYFDDVKVENEKNGWCLITGVRKRS